MDLPIDAAAMTLYVCTTCRDADPAIRIVGVECLSVCKRTCAVSFAAPGKWTYVFGDLPADEAAATVLTGARLYAEAADGIIPWKQRPDALKKGAVARVPALSAPLPALP